MIQYRCRAVAISSPLRMPAITAPPLAPPASRGRLVRDRPSKRTTPPERNMIARRRWFRYWAPQITQLGYVCTQRAKVHLGGADFRATNLRRALRRRAPRSICQYGMPCLAGAPLARALSAL